MLADSQSRVLFAWDGVAEEAGKGAAEAGAEFISVAPAEFLGQAMAHEPIDLVERADDQTAVVLYTSGTTVRPKGAELTHANMARNAEICVNMIDFTPDDVVLVQHPEATSYDVSTLRVCASGGASLPVEVLRGFEETFGAMIVEGYGLSETSRWPRSTTPTASARRARSVNRCRASTSGSSMTNGTTSAPMGSARSRSRATTS